MSDRNGPTMRLPLMTGLVFLVLRGLLLWLVVPAAFLSWLVLWPHWKRKQAKLGHVLG